MFDHVTLRGVGSADGGAQPAVLYGYQQAALIWQWTITKERDRKTRVIVWRLRASVVRHDKFLLRPSPRLVFTAPRRGGLWCWPIVGDLALSGSQLVATLGHPEF